MTLARILLAFGLVALNAFFVAAEFALARVRPTRLRQLAESGDRRARRALQLVGELNANLSAIQLGITVASIGLGWVGEPVFASLLEPALVRIGFDPPVLVHTLAFVIGFALVTFLHVVLGELAPKTLAIQRADAIALWVAEPMHLFWRATWPIVWLFNGAANVFLKLFGVPPTDETETAHSEEELRMLVSASHRHGVLDDTERFLLDNVFDYAERSVRDVMTPRGEVVFLDAALPFDELVKKALDSGYTRFPVHDGPLENLIGFLHIKDLFAAYRQGTSGPPPDIRQHLRALLIVPEAMSVDQLRRRFQETRSHIAAVIDEYGSITGLVTMEDLIEELFGEIHDEFDEQEQAPIVAAGESLEADGEVLLSDIQEHLDWRMEPRFRDVRTIGGVVLTALGRPPRQGDTVRVGGCVIEVLKVSGWRIDRVRVVPERRPEPQPLEEP